jgi:tricorn protease
MLIQRDAIQLLRHSIFAAMLAALLGVAIHAQGRANSRLGYYRFPAIHGDTIIFTAEGDLWSARAEGGFARRLTSDAGMEDYAAISPNGKTVAFSAQYEGPTDAYIIPMDGGLPKRLTWDGDARVEGWTPDGKVLVRTGRYSTLPSEQLVAVDAQANREVLPLAQAADGSYTPDGLTLFFTRFQHQYSFTKRYKGGTAQNIWRYTPGSEAVELTGEYAGTSKDPMFWDGHVYFLSDRDGIMNVYSMDADGHNVKEVTHQKVFDIESASLSVGRIVYSCAADLWLLDLKSGKDAVIPITLVSDFDQLRNHWVKKPLQYLTDAHIAPDGSAAVFTARGEVFTLPADPAAGGRIVKVAGDSSIRFRDARYLPDGKNIVVISTKTGETEFWKYPANGLGAPEQWTTNADDLRMEGVPSPDGHWLASYDKDNRLWLFNTETKQNKLIAQSMEGGFSDLAWSPDSRWLAYVEGASNQFDQIKILEAATGEIHVATSNYYDSESPAWSADGKWLYFISDRMLKSVVESPWGPRQPDPYFDRSMKVYQLALTPGLRSPFAPPDELHPAEAAKNEEQKATGAGEDEQKSAGKGEKPAVTVNIDFNGLSDRLMDVPAPPGNYLALDAAEKKLCWLSQDEEATLKIALQCLDIGNKGDAPVTILPDIKSFELSLDRKKMLVRVADDYYILDMAGNAPDPKALAKDKLDMSHWDLMTNPREEFRSEFVDAWRLERDYFYDQHMNGVNWIEMRDRYLPLVSRVTDRDELSDLISQMVGELSALHTFVHGGDERKPTDDIGIATFGAVLRRDESAGGLVVQHIYRHDPDLPDQAPPFARPDSLVKEGEVILSIDGLDTLSAPDERELLRDKAGRQVLLQVKSTDGKAREVLVTPVTAAEDRNLRYNEWEYSRRLQVDSASHGTIGYVHLRDMGPEDIAQWARDYYPVFNRQGLILDVRHNGGGNIDSWLLGKLLRKAWFYWQPRVGDPYWSMQYAFRGHIVVLCDQWTASDGEAFTEGFKRLGLGKVIGMRTWGGEIWLSPNNPLADNGIATAAQTGLYSPEGKWLIEGHGVDPDIVVDNLPHATFEGKDAQLEEALRVLEEEIQKDPRPVPKHPPYPDKSFRN